MRTPLLIGIAGGIVIGFLQFFSVTSQANGVSGGLLYYSPMLLYFAAIYVSIKSVSRQEEEFEFKNGLKAGVITAVLISIMMAIGYFVGLTHLDVASTVRYDLAHGTANDVMLKQLAHWNRQYMFERAKNWSIPNFLLGFVISLAVTLIIRKRLAKQA